TVRFWASRAEEQRRAARDERMAQLFAEREAAPPPSAMPHSLSAVTSDREPEKKDDADAKDATGSDENKNEKDEKKDEKEVVKVRCRACKALNDEDAKTCKACGAEL